MKILIQKSRTKGIILFFSLFIQIVYSCSSDSASLSKETEPDGSGNTPPTSINYSVSVPTEGNGWVVNNASATNSIIGVGGISNWTNASNKIRTYFYAKKTGEIEVGLRAKFSGNSTLKISLGGVDKDVEFKQETSFDKYYVGKFTIDQIGYHFIEIEGVSRGGGDFGEISDILLGESSWSTSIDYIKPDWFYWGRRGPSVHLSYDEPAGKNITWFYNEVIVPEGNDVIGSYYMANGFADGYFGMQVNSETERRILFSVWSAFDTQDPNQVPDEYTVIPLGYGENVTVGEFGGEGSGAQSYMVYDWKPNTTYKFLLKGESIVNNTIDYTAYIYAPEVGDWQLIASFRRPFSSSNSPHLTSLYSFLENFNTTAGDSERQVDFNNQWIYDTQGNWEELTSAMFTIDNTGRSGVRFDYDGGTNADGNGFYLRNCGFFSDSGTVDTSHTRNMLGNTPIIDFTQLEVPEIPVPVEVSLLDRTNWSAIEYSTQEDSGGEGDTGRAADVLDGNVDTFWHSCWSGGCTATAPHHITIDMGQSNTVHGFKFLQRQTLSRAVKDIEIQMSVDNSNWESLGDYVLQNTATEQYIDLSDSKDFRYFKFITKSSHDGTSNAAIAEISAYIIE